MSDPISAIGNWLGNLLTNWGLGSVWVNIIVKTIGATVVVLVGFGVVILLIWVERKLAGRLQDRLGPNRAGPFGIFQPFADMIKMFTKEDTVPDGAAKVTFNIAPVLLVGSVLLLWAVVPFSATTGSANLNVGVLYIIAVGAMGTLAVILAGWSSNNKFALLGAFRAVAMMVSFEIPMVLALMIPVIFVNSLNVTEIVANQNIWFVFLTPLAALIFLITSMAEVGRAPFDLTEAESEIVAGYHTEYSGMKFGMFYVGEFLHVFTIGALLGTIFLGGWRGPWAEQIPFLGVIYFYIKAFFGYFLITWWRLSLPRIRIDHMLNFAWKILTPLMLVLLILTAILDRVLGGLNYSFQQTPYVYGLSMLVLNVILIWVFVEIMKRVNIAQERQTFETRPLAVPPKKTSTQAVDNT